MLMSSFIQIAQHVRLMHVITNAYALTSLRFIAAGHATRLLAVVSLSTMIWKELKIEPMVI